MPLGTSLRMALRLLRPVVGPMLTYSKNPPYSSFTVLPIKYVYLLFSQRDAASRFIQSYEIKSPPWTILWFRILGIFSVENIKRCVFMFQT